MNGLNEAEVVQNAVLGAALIWRFGLGYQEKSGEIPHSVPLSFIVLPICLHYRSLEEVASTRKASGLALFASKLAKSREDLLSVNSRAKAMRSLTLQSLGIAVQSGLTALDYKHATVRANQVKTPFVAERIKRHWDAANRFGYWCAGLHLRDITTLLKLEF